MAMTFDEFCTLEHVPVLLLPFVDQDHRRDELAFFGVSMPIVLTAWGPIRTAFSIRLATTTASEPGMCAAPSVWQAARVRFPRERPTSLSVKLLTMTPAVTSRMCLPTFDDVPASCCASIFHQSLLGER